MKKACRSWLIGLSLAIGISSVWAQTVPPGLIDNLRVVGIQNWTVVQTNLAYVKNYPHGAGIDVLAYALDECKGESDTIPCYLIKMKVSIENVGDANVLLKDPQLEVSVLQPEFKGEIDATITGTNGQDFKYEPKAVKESLPERIVFLGKARLVRENSMAWDPIAEILASEGTQKAKETQHLFEIIVGPRDLEHAQRLIEAFNIMDDQNRKWFLRLSGTAKVGWRGKGKGESTAMIFSSSPVEVVLKSKPTLPEQLPFPK
jgi:hypothetical protein